MAVVLIRHASAGDRHRWDGPDDDRPLDDKGRRQAGALVGILDGVGIHQVLSSPTARCVQTVEPLAAARGLAVERDERLAEGNAEDACDLLREVAGTATALCTHGDVVPELLEMVARDGVDLGPRPSWPKAGAWLLDDDGVLFTGARLLRPPAG